jgi:hypothetical protein
MLLFVTIYGIMLLMVTCSNCQKELNRFVFCDARCKMAFHRHSKTPKFIKTPEDVPFVKGSCPHGAGKGLCKHGCK